MSPVKPMKTDRSHEENQERAYIAASRRSDRTLEGRVESARRASEVHKRRTGRSLRVTEQDVVDEEVYEEEDDDLATQYRCLTAHLQTQNDDFNRRFQSHLLNHVAMRHATGNAAVDSMQVNNRFRPDAAFIKPNYMKTPQQQRRSAFQGTMAPSQLYNRQQPYPEPRSNPRPIHPSNYSYGRPFSVATTQNVPQFEQEHSQSVQTNLIDAKLLDNRRMSLTGSNSNEQSVPPRQAPIPTDQHRPKMPRNKVLTSPLGASFGQQINAGMDPFTMTLPMEPRQMLADSSILDSSTLMMFSQQSYSYKPNARPRNNATQSYNGLNQTLLRPAIDTSFIALAPSNFAASPQSLYTDSVYIPQCKQGGGMNFNLGYGSDIFKSGFNGSGNVTPQNLEFNGILTFPELSQEEQTLAYSP
ncbi:hypothetical protein LTR56_026518 [Elasticomyces elasticus]|nr:hypothetical protein LTR56_026518 [Elasticomyces elasticus]KAK4901465.1 hypothetical protein LTR49_027235 [Elasticomyces elasticus]KAK5731872.1 hypothetical protein LTS12_027207 [Elasticomyces elasticus]